MDNRLAARVERCVHQDRHPGPLVEALQQRTGTFRNRLVNLEDPRPGGAKRFAEAMSRIRTAGLTAFAGEREWRLTTGS